MNEDAEKTIAKLERRLKREKAARLQAEEQAEKSTRKLYDTVQELETSQARLEASQSKLEEDLRVLSTPILEIWDNVLALPIIGNVDAKRASVIMKVLLATVTQQRARYVILDLTGIEVIDTATANRFLKVIRAVQLLGAEGVLTGIRPAVAQTIADLGVNLDTVHTLRSLRDGLRFCIDAMNSKKKRKQA